MFKMRNFAQDQNGSTATIFAVTLLPLCGFVGGAIDYNRAAGVQTSMQRTADAAAMALVKMPARSSAADINARAQAVFTGAYQSGVLPQVATVTATKNGSSYTVAAAGTVQNTFMQLLGRHDTPVSVTSTVSAGTQRIELALVLDNTGSMGDRIGGVRKIDALKVQTKKLLNDLNKAANEPGSVKVSIVPFDTEVRLDANAYRYKDWFAGLDLPLVRQFWTGYVHDRPGSYVVSDAAPTRSIPASMFPATITTTGNGSLATIKPLTSVYAKTDLDSLTGLVDSMQPRGMTNIALGLNWGLATLSPGEPFTEASPATDKNVRRILVLLTDGLNTEFFDNGKRSQNVGKMDGNTAAACGMIKSASIEVFTIRLLDGNANLLRNCASADTSASLRHFADVQNQADLSATFAQITDAILEPRYTN